MADSDSEPDSAGSIPASYSSKLENLGPTASDDGQRDPDEVATALRAGREKWSNLGREEILAAYRRVIWPLLEADGHDPETTIPTRSWLREHGHANLEYALREYHDTTLSRFCEDVVGVDPGADGYDWPTDHEPSVERLDDWLTTQRERNRSVGSETTVRTKRNKLATFVEIYVDEHDADLLSPVASEDSRAEAFDRLVAVYDRLDERLSTTASKHSYHQAISEFYKNLRQSGRAAFDPTAGLMDRYGWQHDDSDSPVALAPAQIRALNHSAEGLEEQLLVIALGAWGLRRGEVAGLHRDQLVLEGEGEDGAHISFSERKNGPGTVALLYGEQAVRDRLSEVTDAWDEHTAGYLFPSHRSRTGHVSATTIAHRFSDLVQRADVRLPDGSRPTPKHCRRFWYDRYSHVMGEVDEWLEVAAEEQGSSSVDVLKGSYVPGERLRELRRDRMREELADAFNETGR
jgi:hypothetical protein